MDTTSIKDRLNNIFSKYDNIPKKIHISWKSKDIIDKDYSVIKNGIRNLKELNQDYEFTISTDEEVDEYVKSNLSAEDYELIKDKKIVEKTDIWRLLKIYNEGGIYMDIDRLCNKPLSDIITDNIKCILPMYFDIDFSQDIMISCPKNIIHKTAIELNLKRRREGCTDIMYLGPFTYFHAATEVLLGYQLERTPPIEDVMKLRKIIDKCEYLSTYREEPLFDTILYNGPEVSFDKHIMYADENIEHWSIE